MRQPTAQPDPVTGPLRVAAPPSPEERVIRLVYLMTEFAITRQGLLAALVVRELGVLERGLRGAPLAGALHGVGARWRALAGGPLSEQPAPGAGQRPVHTAGGAAACPRE